MRALCSKSIFHVFSVKTPTRLAKKDNPPHVQNPIWALGFETKNQTPSVIHRYSIHIKVGHWEHPSPFHRFVSTPHGEICPQEISAYLPPSVPDIPRSSSYQYMMPHH